MEIKVPTIHQVSEQFYKVIDNLANLGFDDSSISKIIDEYNRAVKEWQGGLKSAKIIPIGPFLGEQEDEQDEE